MQYLRSHSEALYGILLRPNIRQKVCDDINMLADCMKAYKVYFEAKSKQQNIYHSLDHPVRPVNQFTTVENKKAISIVADRYQILNEAVRTAG